MCEQDLEMMAEVSALVERKSTLLTELRTMNTAAAGGADRGADGRYADDFQHRYACTVMLVRPANRQRPCCECCAVQYAQGVCFLASATTRSWLLQLQAELKWAVTLCIDCSVSCVCPLRNPSGVEILSCGVTACYNGSHFVISVIYPNESQLEIKLDIHRPIVCVGAHQAPACYSVRTVTDSSAQRIDSTRVPDFIRCTCHTLHSV
jgi:hypothetical protein